MSVTYEVPAKWAETALIDEGGYRQKYHQSISDPEGFWRDEARRIDWIRAFTVVKCP